MVPAVIGTFIPFAGIAMIVLIVWFKTRFRQARVQARTELHKHLLDKFSSGTELTQFLETEGSYRDRGRGRIAGREGEGARSPPIGHRRRVPQF